MENRAALLSRNMVEHQRARPGSPGAKKNAMIARQSRHLAFRWTLGISTALCTCCAVAVPASAQLSESQPTPPPVYNVDSNGVDLVTGQFYFPTSDVNIGNGDNTLSFSRTLRNGGYESSFDTALNGGAGEFNVIIGSLSDHFTSASGGLSTKGTGARLSNPSSGLYHYTARDGTRYQFEAAYRSTRVRVAQHRATEIMYPGGRTLRIDYNINSSPSYHLTRPKSVQSNDGFRLTFTYQADWLSGADSFSKWMTLASVTATNAATTYCDIGACAGGRTASYAWTADKLKETRTDPAGRALVTTFDSSGRITAVKPLGASSNRYTITYSGANVGSVQTPSGTWQYVFGPGYPLRTVTVTSPTGLQRVVTINRDKIVSDRTGTGGTTNYEYDPSFRVPTKIIAPEGNSISYQYDARDNVINSTITAKGGVSSYSVSATYPATCISAFTCNKPTSTTDARGFTTDYVYDPTHGGVTSIKPPSPDGVSPRPETRYSYEGRPSTYYVSASATTTVTAPVLTSISQCASGSAPACTGTGHETRTDITYPTSGLSNRQPVSITARAGDSSVSATHSFAYTGFGQVASIDGPIAGSADTAALSYDVAGALAESRLPDPDGAGAQGSRATRIIRDAEGRVTESQIGYYPNGNTTPSAFVVAESVKSDFDVTTALKASVSLVAGGSTIQKVQYAYDIDSRMTCEAQRMNPAAFATTADACALGPEGTQGPDRITKVAYDSAGYIYQRTNAFGTTSASIEQVAHTPNGKVAAMVDAEGNRTGYIYDGYDRLAKTEYPSTSKGANTSNTADYEQRTYDANGNIVARRLRDGQVIGYTYDNLNRLSYYDQPVAGAYWDLAYEYDLLGRLKKATGNGWAVNAFTYDSLGRLTTEQNYNNTTYHAYDPAGRQTRLTWHDGFYVDYDYDATGNVTAIRENGATSGVGVLASYGYDNLGRRTIVTRGNGTVTSYSHDSVSRLASLTQDLGGGAYDLTLGFSYNPASQIASNTRSNDTYAWGGHYNVDRNYASNGLNQLTFAGSTALSYDGRGNLGNSGSNAYGYSVENRLITGPGFYMAYEPTGNRILGITAGSTDTRFAWSGDQMITEIAAPSWQVLRRYVPGPNVDERVVWYEGAGTTDRRWLHADERGSVIAVTNGAGAPININRYDEYGIPETANIGRFGYTGQAWIPELGMWFYKARVYSPTLGRFMQTDPIGYADGMNWYNYVKSDPVNSRDPLGLDTICNDSGGCWDAGFDEITVGGSGREIVINSTSMGNYHGPNNSLRGLMDVMQYDGIDAGDTGLPPCPTGSKLNLGGGVSATGFLAVIGVSAGLGGGVSVPTASLPLVGDGSFTGTEISGAASITPLIGLGVFLGVGPSYSLGGSNGAADHISGSITPVIQGGAGDGAGVEASADLSSPLSVSGAMGRIAGGMYGALGARFEGRASTGPLGCI